MIEVTAGGVLASESADVLVVPVLDGRTWGPGADWVAEQLGDYLIQVLDDGDLLQRESGHIVLSTNTRPSGVQASAVYRSRKRS